MNKKLFAAAFVAMISGFAANAEKIEVSSFRHAGPVSVKAPIQFEQTDVNGKKLDVTGILNGGMDLTMVEKGSSFSGGALSAPADAYSVGLLGFEIQNDRFFKGSIDVDSALKNYQVYVNGKKQSGTVTFEPGNHKVVVKYAIEPGASESVKVSVDVPEIVKDHVQIIDMAKEDGRLYTVTTLLDSRRSSGVSLSPDGKYMIVRTSQRAPGHDRSFVKIIERESGNVISEGQSARWMPKTNRYWFTRQGLEGLELVTVDPASGKQEVLVKSLPEGSFDFTPTEDKLIYTIYNEGPQEKKEIFEILVPDDRQPGWRNRSSVAVYDLATGVMQPLTYGYNNAYLSDVSNDGHYALLSKSEARLTARPTDVNSLYLVDLQSLELVDTLVCRDGFVHGGQFSPDGKKVLITGTPEAFDWLGAAVDEGQTPSMTDIQLYMLDIASKEVTPLTKEFDPCVQSAVWNKLDNKIYFTAENRDSVSLFTLDPANGKFNRMDLPEELIRGFSIAAEAPVLAFHGQGATNSDRLYATDLKTFGTKKQKISLIEDFSAKSLKGITVGDCIAWTFKNSLGEEVLCRYYLPVNFDPSKKYPMIVNYYGGCSPTSRNFESNYPQETWSALGYVALIVQPSGATGFGQKWSARHVNTAGVDPARDIIEATKEFTATHDFVNADKIGCVGASYGGFMTMYLQTITDIFACAISHAGISDHTSYWGYGYWGYSYSETSMANSYPWTRKDLFVEQSPLYHPETVNTPLLFLHGTVDTNVPYNESVQMFTALKLLGKETAFVSVDGENHHINEYNKHIWWHNTQMAWFAKYLQDDDSWWEALYPHKDL